LAATQQQYSRYTICCNCEWGELAAKERKDRKNPTPASAISGFIGDRNIHARVLPRRDLWFYLRVLPCVIFEDEHLLVVNKPPGWNTHAPSPYASEGIYDWLRHREARWSRLAIIHRLDKETSGVMLFSKTALANRSLTKQFTNREVRKRYLLLTDRPPRKKHLTIKSCTVRAGEKYVSRPLHAGGDVAETRFEVVSQKLGPPDVGCHEIRAEPLTGRTHQIRVHASDAGFPILGDQIYAGTAAARVYLHATELMLKHPVSGDPMSFCAPVDFETDPRFLLRAAFVEPELTNAYRLIHGASDGWPGLYLDRLGDYLLSQSESALRSDQNAELLRLKEVAGARGIYHKILTRHTRKTVVADASPRLTAGEAAPERFVIRENGLQFELSFSEGYSVGLFLDQRDNRRRILTGHVASEFGLPWAWGPRSRAEVLNAFAYTCGFSVCAAKAGVRTTSIDLSKKYLEWGKRNFQLNGIDPTAHDFIYGDVFDWLRRLAKKQRLFDVILLDPPTFSQSKESGIFRAEKDYSNLITLAVPLLKRSGVLFASTNASGWAPEDLLKAIESGIRSLKRRIIRLQYFPQPPDFPITRQERAYLKTAWMQIE
jgi:23S rRNA (cytosine1962-C5)-methyltransferase